MEMEIHKTASGMAEVVAFIGGAEIVFWRSVWITGS